MGDRTARADTLQSKAAAPTGIRWRIVMLLMGLAAINHFNRISMPVAGIGIMEQYGIAEQTIGWVYSAFLLAYTLSMTPGGWLVDGVGPRRALAWMGLGSACFVALTGLAGALFQTAFSVWLVLLGVRFCAGMCSAPIHPGAARSVSLWFPYPAQGGANGLVNGAAMLGAASTYILFGGLSDTLGWPIAFGIAAVVTAGWATGWLAYATDRPDQHPAVNASELDSIQGNGEWAIPEKPRPTAPASQVRPRSLLANRSLVLLTVSYAAVGYIEFLFNYWMERYFDKVLHLAKSDARFYSTMVTLTMAAGMFLGGWLADRSQARYGRRLGRALVPALGMLASAAFATLGVWATQPLLVVACFALAMASVGATEGPYWTTATELGGQRGGTSAALFNTGGNVGGLLAPVVTPYIARYVSWEWSVGVAALFCVLGASLWCGVDPAERVEEAGPAPSLPS